jgi:hypothetical protein
LAACDRAAEPRAAGPEVATGPVTVKISLSDFDRDDIVIRVEDVESGTTVEALMTSLPDVPVEIRGSGTTAFVDSLAGVATGANSGWTYRIDGEFVNRGIGVTRLEPPATVSWSFNGWEETSTSDE